MQHKVHSKIDFHGSQTYRIIRSDGAALVTKPNNISPDRAKIRLTEVLGHLFYHNKATFG